jgi:hypothetical protein
MRGRLAPLGDLGSGDAMSAESKRRQKLCRDAGCFCTERGFNKEIAYLREALEFYADSENYGYKMDCDNGKIARDALEYKYD